MACIPGKSNLELIEINTNPQNWTETQHRNNQMPTSENSQEIKLINGGVELGLGKWLGM